VCENSDPGDYHCGTDSDVQPNQLDSYHLLAFDILWNRRALARMVN